MSESKLFYICMVVQFVAFQSLTSRVQDFELALGLMSVWSFCSSHIHMGFLLVHWVPFNVQKHADRWTGYSKLPLYLNKCVNGVLQWTGIPSRMIVKPCSYSEWDKQLLKIFCFLG